jgi:hypothetical protein
LFYRAASGEGKSFVRQLRWPSFQHAAPMQQAVEHGGSCRVVPNSFPTSYTRVSASSIVLF